MIETFDSVTRGRKLLVTLLLVAVAFGFSACSSSANDLTVGDEAPDFSLLSANNNEISLHDYEGSPVLLYFHMAMG